MGKAEGSKKVVADEVGEEKAVETPDEQFPIVGVGASAGGLKAFETLFKNLPDRPGMAFVLVQHLDPNHESELSHLLQNHTAMPVSEVEERTRVHPDHVYVIPPGKRLSIRDGVLHLSEPEQPRGQRALIDLFFRSLAQDQGANAVCIILSGTGSDGSLGLKSVKEAGGIVLVQEPDEAEYNGMPRNAIATGLVDFAAPVAELAQRLVSYQQSAGKLDFSEEDAALAEANADVLQRIFTQVHSQTGHDFSAYKRTTVLRRLQRRIQVNQVTELSAYLDFLRGNREEANALFADFLISVTNFFRDEKAFAALEKDVIPALFDGKNNSDRLRVWVPGCATGEEAYSIAILLLEESTRRSQRGEPVPKIQIFATDINEETLAFARRGLYPAPISADVSQERLSRFFSSEAEGYRVNKGVKEVILFARHNLLRDAPFAHLDLISCRNLLIYLQREMQQQLFRIFHYALRPGSFLFLGTSESADLASDRFDVYRMSQRIYRRRDVPPALPNLPVRPLVAVDKKPEPAPPAQESVTRSMGDMHRQLMLQRYGPPSALVDAQYQIRYNFGDVGRYLRFYEGAPTLSILESVLPALRPHLRTALYQVFRHWKPFKPRLIRVEVDGQEEYLFLSVDPVVREETAEELALVIFEPAPPPTHQLPLAQEDGDGAREEVIEQLESALRETEHRLQTTVEEYETSNEELKSSNEELQSTNEELRSTTEELETSREELRSTNEELISVNEELKSKVDELNQVNSDLANLMESTDLALLFLDSDLCLKRYTPEATALFNVIPADLGRPFAHISHKIEHDGLAELAEKVLKTLESVEEVVKGGNGEWYLLQIRPYRTLEDRIRGVVITLVEITAQVNARHQEEKFARQQGALAELGHYALQEVSVRELMELVTRLVALNLSVPIVHVLTPVAGEDRFQVAARFGWEEAGSDTDALAIPMGNDSQAGYALQLGQTVLIEDRAAEQPFTQADAIRELGVASGGSVLIPGDPFPVGVLEVYSREPRSFSPRERHFLQAVANILGTALQREESARALKERGWILQAVLDQMPSGLSLAEAPSGRLLLHNEEAVRILRHPMLDSESYEGYQRYGALHGIDEPYAPEEYPITRALAGEVVHQEEMLYRRGDGTLTTFSVNAAPVRDEEGNIVMAVSTFHDISHLQKLQAELEAWNELLEARVEERTEELSEARNRFHALFHATPVPTVLTRIADGLVLDANEAYLDFFGYKREQVIGQRTTDLTIFADPADREAFRRLVEETGEVRGREVRLLAAGGEERLASASVALSPLEGETAAISTFVDLTARIRQEQQIRALASALTVAEQREQQRIAQVLHDDLQQLIYALQTQLVLMQSTAAIAEDEDLHEKLESLRQLSDEALAVTRTLTVELSPPVLEGEGLKEAFLWLAEHMAEAHELTVELNVQDGLALLDDDVEKLAFQLVRELLFNVAKHAGVGKARLAFYRKAGGCVIEVSDAGVGFDPDALAGRDRRGFGLRTIQERLSLFGGEFELSSTPGEGTTALLRFPCAQETRESEAYD